MKRRSTSPLPTAGFPGGPCAQPEACTDRPRRRTAAASTAQCDSSPGAGDGECDACHVRFGTTTEDEMFILLGAFYTD